MNLHPPDHPDRELIAAEVHARPAESLTTPERVSTLTVLIDPDAREREFAHVTALCERHGVAPPSRDQIHFSVALDRGLRFKWARHGEFSTFTIFVPGLSERPFAQPAAGFLPEGWLAQLPGRTLYAAHAKLVPVADAWPETATLPAYFDGNIVIGGEIGDGVGMALTDFRVHADGFARFVVLDRAMTPRQSGRMLQRLFEIDSYRMLTLLGLPVARRLAPKLTAMESALARLIEDIARGAGDDEQRLDELTRLAVDVESARAASQYRFGASRAYYELVRTRIGELRERRVRGLQTIDEFIARRLAPAIATCNSASQRLHDLSERVGQASALLSTRVEIAREQHNQALLVSMDKRARLQLRLQQTVEGLSVAAISYYVVGLVGSAAKAAGAAGLRWNPDLVAGASIPVVVLLIWAALRRVRRKFSDAAPRSARHTS